MIKKLLNLLSFFLIIVIAFPLYANDEQDKFMEGKELCISQKWLDAITSFEEFLEKYPDSRYSDDASFWIAYSLEKLPGKQKEAFMAFSSFTEKFPESNWKDDAIMHQINLAEGFVRKGEDQYREFLYTMLNSEYDEIKYRSAISLGRLGDDKALPVLEGLKSHEDYGPLAANLSSILQNSRQNVAQDSSYEEMRMVYEKGIEPQVPDADEDPETAPPRDSFLWFNTQRYEQYRSMLRKDDKWSEDDLIQFALWHVADADEFDELRALTDDYDRKEWIRKYWKDKDPTPTTQENELQDEFERRVGFARSEFSEPWNYTHFRYLPDEHLREGWYRAPWDARGELYIKYGEPDVRSVQAYHTEEWIYYKYGVDFIVRQFRTNIYGNAINAGSITRGLHSEQNFPQAYDYNYVYPFLNNEQQEYLDWKTSNTYLDANFVYKNEMRYFHNYDADPLSDFEMEIFSSDSILLIKYQLPVDELKMIETGDNYEVRYTESYSILDEDLREVASGSTDKHITGIADDGIRLEQEIKISLIRGNYRISIQIRDNNSKKLGIYTKDYEAP